MYARLDLPADFVEAGYCLAGLDPQRRAEVRDLMGRYGIAVRNEPGDRLKEKPQPRHVWEVDE